MKTTSIHFDQAFLDSTKLMITGVKAIKLFALSGIKADRVNYYLTLLVKQIFSDNFSGSDAEVGMVLIFLKGYFLSAADLLKNNVITDFFRKLKTGQSNIVVLDTEQNYSYNKAA